jgi:hypothetical protein
MRAAATAIVVLGAIAGAAAKRSTEKCMKEPINAERLRIAADSRQGLSERVTAIQRIGGSGDDCVAELRALLARPRPGPEQRTVNWDPAAAERDIDLHVVAALHQLGDDSELGRIPRLIADATVSQGEADEAEHAAAAVSAIGQPRLVGEVIALCAAAQAPAARNAVRVLERLALPRPATRGPLAGVPCLDEPQSFDIHTAREEIEAFAQRSHGSIVVSPGVRAWLAAHDYDRGPVHREKVSLAWLIQHTLERLGFDYALEDHRVVLCTFAEAAERWRAWWRLHGGALTFEHARGYFVR